MLSSIMEPAEVGVLLEKWRSICLPPERIVAVVTTALRPIGFYGVGWTPDGQFWLAALTEKEAEPEGRKGDVSYAGVWVRAGTVLLVAPFVLRLVCQNGLSLPAEVIAGCGSQDEMERRLTEAMARQLARAEDLLGRFVATDTQLVADYRGRLEALCAELRLGMPARQSALDYLQHLEMPVTEYDVTSAIAGLASLNPRISDFVGGLAMTCPSGSCDSSKV